MFTFFINRNDSIFSFFFYNLKQRQREENFTILLFIYLIFSPFGSLLSCIVQYKSIHFVGLQLYNKKVLIQLQRVFIRFCWFSFFHMNQLRITYFIIIFQQQHHLNLSARRNESTFFWVCQSAIFLLHLYSASAQWHQNRNIKSIEPRKSKHFFIVSLIRSFRSMAHITALIFWKKI